MLSKSKFGFSKIALKTYRVRFAIVGDQIPEFSAAALDSLVFRVSYLKQWLGITGFETSMKFVKSDGKDKLDEASITYRQPPPIQARCVDGSLFEIRLSTSMPLGRFDELTLTEHASVTFTPAIPQPFEQLLAVAARFADLLSLATGQNVQIKKTSVFTANSTTSLPNGTSSRNNLEVHYQPAHPPVAERQFHAHQSVIPFQSISARFDEVVRRWLEHYARLEPTLRTYFATVDNPRMYLETQFSNLCNCVESFHRENYGGDYETRETYLKGLHKTLVAALPQSMSADYRTSAAMKLQYLNEYSLRRRLKEVLDGRESCLANTKESADGFIAKVVDTRNYMVHRSPDLRDRAVYGTALHPYVRDLDRLLRACFIELLGFDTTQACSMLES